MKTPAKPCSFCGTTEGTFYIDGFNVCDDDQCDNELIEALRERDEMAQEAAFLDDFDRYR